MHDHPSRRDFDANARLLRLSAIAIVIGALSTVAARVLLLLIRFFTDLFFYQRISVADLSPAQHSMGAWVIVVPAIGGLIIGLIARFGTEQVRGHGIPEAIEAILFKNSAMSPKVAVLKPMASGIAIGSGGPFGAEGPIIMTGGAIGSLVAQHFSLTGAERKALLVAGAVAGMTAVFGTPVAAVLMAVELLLFELRPRSLLPVALACAVAGFLRPLAIGSGPLFAMQTAPASPSVLGACLIAGVLCGCLAWIMSSALYRLEDMYSRLPLHWMWWPALGGLVVGIGGFFEPRALGVGYDVIGDLLHNHLALTAVAALLLVKLVIWVFALASGTSGGVLAPLLMLGAGLGVVIGPFMPGGEPALWPLVCMAATLGGMMRAPIMAAVFAFELSGDANALLPLLATSAIAYAFTVLTMGRSILTEKIARRGYHIYREYGIDPLERQSVAEVMTRSVQSVDASHTVARVLASHFGASQAHRAYPVLRDGQLAGMLDRAALDGKSQAMTVGELYGLNYPLVALPHETCRMVASRLAAHHVERVPVVAAEGSHELVGIVSRSDLIKASQSLHADEHERRALRRTPFSALFGSRS